MTVKLFSAYSCLLLQDACRWYTVAVQYITVFLVWQMDLRPLFLNKFCFIIHNFTGFVLYVAGLNRAQHSSAWHFQFIGSSCQQLKKVAGKVTGCC